MAQGLGFRYFPLLTFSTPPGTLDKMS
jgi:hypothetical protein